MVASAQTQTSGFDTVKLLLAIVLFVAGVVGFYWFGQISILYRALALIGVAIVAGGIAYTTEQGRRGWAFARDSRTELRRVVWPTRAETLQTTAIVLLITLLVAVFLWLLDMLLQWGFGAVTGIGG